MGWTMKNVLVAMSGGVDSSVAAFLLSQQGYSVTGVTMRLCEDYNDSDDVLGLGPVSDPDCENEPTTVDLARSVAESLGADFMVVDYRNEFQEMVVEPFIRAYEEGRTPNPCIECNKCLKFDKLLDDSDEGFEDNPEEAPLLATGHYARLAKSDESSRIMLRKAADLSKDQSYFLYALSQETLSRVIFPLGELTKEEVRRIADEQCYANAKKKDSQDICFIPDGDYASYIRRYTGRDYPEGDFVDLDGNVLGRHKGVINYTVGQRKGLGLSLKKPMYVYRLDPDRNQVVLADDEQLYSRTATVSDFNWVSKDEEAEGASFRALGRIRYRHKEAPCTVTVLEDDKVRVEFDEPQRAITSGQALVLYDIETDEYVLGGGTIE